MKTTQRARVEFVVGEGEWLALHEIAARTRRLFARIDSEAAVSARLRDLRRAGWTVDRRRRGGTLREYRCRPPVVTGQMRLEGIE